MIHGRRAARRQFGAQVGRRARASQCGMARSMGSSSPPSGAAAAVHRTASPRQPPSRPTNGGRVRRPRQPMASSDRAEINGGGGGGDRDVEREEEAEEKVESKWTNISQMVALLFVTVAAEGGGARARCRRRTRTVRGTDTREPRHQNAIEGNRGRLTHQIANGARETKTCLVSPSRSLDRYLTLSIRPPFTDLPQ